MPTFQLRGLRGPARLLVTWFLVAMGLGFGAAQFNLLLQHGPLDGKPGLSYDDVVAAFHGLPGSTTLTSKIGPGGSMRRYIPMPEDQAVVEKWVETGAGGESFEAPKQVLDRLCVRCHNPGGAMPQARLAASRAEGARYDLVSAFTGPDQGMSTLSLARSSHAHLFGMGVLYAIAGVIFMGSSAKARLKAVVVSLPFVAMFIDIGCWWLTKMSPGFAVGVMAGGGLLAVAFGVLILWPLCDLWICKSKAEVS